MMRNYPKISSLIITIIIGLIWYYIFLPPMNIQSFSFYSFVLILSIIYIVILSTLTVSSTLVRPRRVKFSDISTASKVFVIAVGVTAVLIIFINIILSPVFNSKSYYNRITVKKDSNFSKDVKEADFTKMPLLDKNSSQKLGDRVMGEMPELVSQFDVSDLYTQINYNNKIIRVTPLEYNGMIKYFTNRSDGVKGYITVDSTNGESKLVKLKKGMKYMPSAMFNENIDRKLRFLYPTKIFGEKSFEIDNDGNPYWIVPTLKYSGVELKKDVKSVIIFNPINGKSKEYSIKDVPSWVDHVYPSNLIIEQVDDWGQYEKGYINSLFGQKGVVKTTTGYNYLAQDDDIFLYTGITSVISDESNIGFILTNMRTKETKFYSVSGAEENSAMESARGQVQEKNYSATFPLLINLNNKPTYLISLKDNAGLVKMYAFVDVKDYQKVVVTDSSEGIQKASSNYLNEIGDEVSDIKSLKTKEIVVSSIKSIIIDGNSYFYITDTDKNKYKCSIKVSKDYLPFIQENDNIKISYAISKDVTEIKQIEIIK